MCHDFNLIRHVSVLFIYYIDNFRFIDQFKSIKLIFFVVYERLSVSQIYKTCINDDNTHLFKHHKKSIFSLTIFFNEYRIYVISIVLEAILSFISQNSTFSDKMFN